MDLSLLTSSTILLFLLMLIRITGMVVSAPFFGQLGVPVQLQVGCAVTFSLILFPLYSAHAQIPADNLWVFSWIAAQEFVLGMLIGFTANMVFAAVQLAGSHVTTQMGLGVAHLIDPVTQEQSALMGQFYFLLAMFLFLSLNIHHGLIQAVARSFELMPLAHGFSGGEMVVARLMSMAADIFVLSVLLVMPILGILLLQEIALAFVSKVLPQMNIFMTALPLKVGMALLLIYGTIPYTQEVLGGAYQDLIGHMMGLYNGWR